MSRQIVKVQLALNSSEDDAPALVYAERRLRMQTLDVTPELLARMANRPKAFFYATWSKEGGWQLGEEAPPQPW